MRRRRLRGFLASLILAALVTAACSGDGGETTSTTRPYLTTTSSTTTTIPPTTTTIPTRFGGSAVVGEELFAEPTTLNPYAPGGDSTTVTKIGQAIYARGWDWDPATGTMIPDLLEQIPTVGNGGVRLNEDLTMSVTYAIREGAVWADGTPITGSDLGFTIDTLAALAGTEGPAPARAYELVIATDAEERGITVTLSQPTLEYEQLFEWILPRHAMEGTDLRSDWNEEPFLGAGPFVFESWEPGSRLTLSRNPNYWKFDDREGRPLPFLDELIFAFIPDTEQLAAAFVAREVDVIEPPAALTSYSTIRFDEPGMEVQQLPGPVWEQIGFQYGPSNRNDDSINANLAYRRAIAHAIGDSLDDVVPYWTPIDSYLDAGRPELSTQAWDRYDYDPEAALALLEQAKQETGESRVTAVFTTTSNADERPAIAAALQEKLEAIGIRYQNQLEDSQLFFGGTVQIGTFDIGLWAWVFQPSYAGMIGSLDVFAPTRRPPVGSNYYRWGTSDSSVRDEYTERFTEIFAALQTTVDVDEADRLIVEAERLLADQAVIIPLWARRSDLVVWADELEGVVHNPSQWTFLWNVEEWRRADL